MYQEFPTASALDIIWATINYFPFLFFLLLSLSFMAFSRTTKKRKEKKLNCLLRTCASFCVRQLQLKNDHSVNKFCVYLQNDRS